MIDQFTQATHEELQRESDLANAGLFERLEGLPHRFDFFHGVRRLESLAASQDYPRIGYSLSRAGDLVHFGQRPFLEFAPRTIDEFSAQPLPECKFNRPVLLVYFLGLFGPNGPLPLHLTQLALERQRQGDFTLTNFANIFQHRFLCFFYRAWSCTRIAADMDRPSHQRFSTFIGSSFGSGAPPVQNRALEFQLGYGNQRPEGSQAEIPPGSQPVAPPAPSAKWTKGSPDWPKLFFAGRLACQTRNAEGLQAIIQDYFGLATEILTFFARWIALPAGGRCNLGASRDACELGESIFLGKDIWDCQMSFRIRLGPLMLADLERMLPGSAGFERLKRWVLEYIGWELRWDVQLVLRKDQVPKTVLGVYGRLGWTTYLKSQPFERHADDLVLAPEEQ